IEPVGPRSCDHSDRDLYNGVRPHQHLEGQIVPAEAWEQTKLRSSQGRYFSAWNGTLTGFY
ncbi:MAG: hypothetical protein MPN21_27140, partial [Thermoanaerobaculia bacterium]|nr:hypothetical protein [Thermoanaerobaculia bacterium]